MVRVASRSSCVCICEAVFRADGAALGLAGGLRSLTADGVMRKGKAGDGKGAGGLVTGILNQLRLFR